MIIKLKKNYMIINSFLLTLFIIISKICESNEHDLLTINSNLNTDQNIIQSNSSHLIDNITLKQLELEQILGPRKKNLTFVLCMGTVYILILLCGIIGNISTCFVIIYNNCMHTTTNYYLFSLAVSDVLSLLMGLPTELYSIIIEAYPWPFGETFCVMRTFIFETTTIASVLTILTFTFERWLHICKAIYAKKFSSGFSRVLKIIVFIWVISGLLALPYAFTTGVYYEDASNPESKNCNLLKIHRTLMGHVIQLSVLFLFIVPMTLISLMYILIGITLWKSSSKHKNSSYLNYESSYNQNSCHNQKNKKDNLAKINKVHKLVRKKDKKMSMTKNEKKILSNYDTKLNRKMPKLNDSICEDNIPRNMSELSVTLVANNVSIHAYDRTSKDFEHISYRARQSRRDVVKMLFVVVLSFFTCWAPYHLQRFLTTFYNPTSSLMMTLFEYLFYISGISIYISSTINPILYNVMSKRYRTAFKNTIKMLSSCSFSSKSNQAFRNSAYHSSINFNAKKKSNSARVVIS